jgi:phosphoribosyl 1,2-cyclic phosphodiesterase
MTIAAISIRIVERDGVQADLRLPEDDRPDVDALATLFPFTVAGRRFRNARKRGVRQRWHRTIVPRRRRRLGVVNTGDLVTVQVINIGSGSSGNALLIRDGTSSLLVDCGVGPRAIEASLRAQGLTWGSLAGIVVSHEHSDHVKALPSAIRKGVRIFSTEGTAYAARLGNGQYRSIEDALTGLAPGISVRPLKISHDAAEPCGFDIAFGDTRICVITDTGEALDHFIAPIQRADLLIVEANHDERMLWNGPYPHHLKVRVDSTHGHLSNAAAGELLREALKSSSSRPEIWLGHLSETNNRPGLAVDTVRRALGTVSDEFRLTALSRCGGQQWSSDEPVIRQLRMLDFG